MLLIFILKTSKSTESATKLKKDRVVVSGDGKIEYNGRCKFGSNEIGGGEFEDDKIKKNNQKTSKSKNLAKSKIMESSFFISGASLAYTKLRQAFVKAPILYHFDLEYHI